MQFTPTQIKELLELIDVHVLKFLAQNVTTKYMTKDELRLLAKYGIEITGTPTVDMAFKLGMLSELLKKQGTKDMSFNQLRTYLEAKKYIPLDYREQKALESIKYQAYSEIRGLGKVMSTDFSRVLINNDKAQRAAYEKIIEDTAREAILNRQSLKEMSSALGHKTGDWARDFDRISDYILHEAHDTGRGYQIERVWGKGAQVYKHVFDQACKICTSLYMTNGMGSEPRAFTVAELRANGSNIGRKAKDWKPVVGATHPWCRCEMETIPDGGVWDNDRQEFVIQLSPEEKKLGKLIKVVAIP